MDVHNPTPWGYRIERRFGAIECFCRTRPIRAGAGGTFSVAKTPRLSVLTQIAVLLALTLIGDPLPWLLPRKSLYIGLPVGYAHSQRLA